MLDKVMLQDVRSKSSLGPAAKRERVHYLEGHFLLELLHPFQLRTPIAAYFFFHR